MDDCSLARRLERICLERGISWPVGSAAFSMLIEAMHEAQFKANQESGSLIFQTYRALGDSAAYHLAGLMSDSDEGMAFEELKYIDRSVSRFRTTVKRWEMEKQWEQEANE